MENLQNNKPGKQLSIVPRSFTKKFIFHFIILVLLLIFLLPISPHLIISDGDTGKILYKTSIKSGEHFNISYIHSIHLTPVVEDYQVSNDNYIVLNEVQFDTYSVGMPSELNEGESIELKDGKIIISNMHRIFPYIDLRIGQVIANHRLTINKQTFKLADISAPGSWVRIKIIKLSIFGLLGD